MAKEIVLIPPFLVNEICRYGGSELHVISAIFGGIAAQEAIKVIFLTMLKFILSLLPNNIYH